MGSLRKDAEANREKVLQAARTLIIERGNKFSMEHVAEVAGVGIGTVYRRYPTKSALIEAAIIERLDQLDGQLIMLLEKEEPWESFCGMIDLGMKYHIELATLQSSNTEPLPETTARRNRVVEHFDEILQRAQEAQVVRSELAISDFAVIFSMLGVEVLRHSLMPEDIRQRMAGLIIAGCRHPEVPIPTETTSIQGQPLGSDDFIGILQEIRRTD